MKLVKSGIKKMALIMTGNKLYSSGLIRLRRYCCNQTSTDRFNTLVTIWLNALTNTSLLLVEICSIFNAYTE
ncbi:hypothetical protein [Desulfobacter sp. UBA2225]|uniref:hypothetical protein n=1 Tax=Desulfobacter sp. UBA2225 TaxID=1961413 RepID=UPI00257CEB05|nr:hypothetical protein [Desulfobacter sp. UBA2225]